MKKKLYAEELFKRILTIKELKVLETTWIEDLSEDDQLELLVKEIKKCSNSE
jgi:hypothetical protein